MCRLLVLVLVLYQLLLLLLLHLLECLKLLLLLLLVALLLLLLLLRRHTSILNGAATVLQQVRVLGLAVPLEVDLHQEALWAVLHGARAARGKERTMREAGPTRLLA